MLIDLEVLISSKFLWPYMSILWSFYYWYVTTFLALVSIWLMSTIQIIFESANSDCFCVSSFSIFKVPFTIFLITSKGRWVGIKILYINSEYGWYSCLSFSHVLSCYTVWILPAFMDSQLTTAFTYRTMYLFKTFPTE